MTIENIEKKLVAPTMHNARLMNLDMDEAGRRAAMAEAAGHLEALAALPRLSAGAANIVRMVNYMMPGWGDAQLFQQEVASAMRGNPFDTYGDTPEA